MQRKIRIPRPMRWPHQRSGWGPCVERLVQELSCGDGILCLDTEGKIMQTSGGRVIEEDFILISHLAPHGHRRWPQWNLQALAAEENWRRSRPRCRGVLTLSRYACRFARQVLDVPCDYLYHATEPATTCFSPAALAANPDKCLIMLGCWLRRYVTLARIKAAGFRKVYMPGKPEEATIVEMLKEKGLELGPCQVQLLPPDEFDVALSRNVVLLDFFDASANNSVIECIARRTPLLVRRFAPLVEYLGPDYPLYFRDPAEAEAKLHDFELLTAAHHYLGRPDVQNRIDLRLFATRFAATSVYQNL